MQNQFVIALPIDAIVQVTFLLLLIIYSVFTVILYYHWQSYSMDEKATLQTYLSYFVVTLPLLAIMGFSLLII